MAGTVPVLLLLSRQRGPQFAPRSHRLFLVFFRQPLWALFDCSRFFLFLCFCSFHCFLLASQEVTVLLLLKPRPALTCQKHHGRGDSCIMPLGHDAVPVLEPGVAPGSNCVCQEGRCRDSVAGQWCKHRSAVQGQAQGSAEPCPPAVQLPRSPEVAAGVSSACTPAPLWMAGITTKPKPPNNED